MVKAPFIFPQMGKLVLALVVGIFLKGPFLLTLVYVCLSWKKCFLITRMLNPFPAVQDHFHLLSLICLSPLMSYIANNKDPEQTAYLGAESVYLGAV